jgi:hypothetical protein
MVAFAFLLCQTLGYVSPRADDDGHSTFLFLPWSTRLGSLFNDKCSSPY